jgi:hypothetical protein
MIDEEYLELPSKLVVLLLEAIDALECVFAEIANFKASPIDFLTFFFLFLDSAFLFPI